MPRSTDRAPRVSRSVDSIRREQFMMRSLAPSRALLIALIISAWFVAPASAQDLDQDGLLSLAQQLFPTFWYFRAATSSENCAAPFPRPIT